MKKVYISVLVCCCMAVCRYAVAQPIAVGFDSLKRLIPKARTSKDSLYLFQQLVDADPTFSLHEPGNVSVLLRLDKQLHLIDPQPYLLLQQAWQFASRGKTRPALDNTIAALHIFDKQHKKINPLLFNIRLYFNALNDQEARLKFYQQQLAYYQVNGPYENMAPCYHGIAGYYYNQAQYNLAITYYLRGAELYRKFSGYYYYNAVNVVASNYIYWGNYERAQYYLVHIVTPLNAIYGKVNYNNLVTSYWAAFGLIDEHYKRYDKALGDIDKAMAAFVNQKANTGIDAILLVRKAQLFLESGQVPKALPLLKRAQFMTDSAKYPIFTTQGTLEPDYGFYMYYRSIGQSNQALKYLQAAIVKTSREHANALRLKYAQAASDFYEYLRQPYPALQFDHQYRSLLDSLDHEGEKFKIAQFEIDQNDRQQREHINQLKQQKAIQDYQLSQRNILLGVALGVILLVVFLLAFIYKQLVVNKKTLISLRQTQRQLIQSEKMASLGELTAGIAHEIQNPLNFVNNFSEVNREMLEELKAESEKPKAERDDKVEIGLINDLIENEKKIVHHGKRADFIVKGMLEHSRTSTGEKQLTDMNVLCDEFLKLSYHGLRAKDKNFNAEFVTHFDKNLPKANVSQQDMGRVMLNLFNNAFYAVNQKQKTAGADYKPQVAVTTSAENGNIVIRVKDNGNGIPDAIKDKIMQPFFTTKPTGQGTGLGLSLSYDIVVKGHGGNITVETKEGKYTEFTVMLPIN